MGRKKKTPLSNESLIEVSRQATALQKEYISDLDTNPKYSLKVDRENKYHMSEQQKEFIKHYVNFKSVATAAEICGIDMDIAKAYFVSFQSQAEIRRINLALYQRQFANKLLTLDEIGGYLTSLITDENVPLADQLKTIDKLKVISMLIDLNKTKIESLSNPTTIMAQDLDIEIKNLSIQTIQQLLKAEKKPKVIETGEFAEVLSPEENAYLSTLSTKELLNLIDETNKGDKKDDKSEST